MNQPMKFRLARHSSKPCHHAVCGQSSVGKMNLGRDRWVKAPTLKRCVNCLAHDKAAR